MEAKELRIGNWVQSSSNKEYQINLSWYECCKDSTEGRDIQLDTFPIPLTEEWLIKLGFEIVGINAEYNWLLLWKNKLTKNFDFVLNEVHSNKRKVTELKYVHQLQSLYFALTGEELNKQE